MKVLQKIAHGIVWVAVVPLLTYWFVAKSFWVHTESERLILLGMIAFGVLMFAAITRTPRVKPSVYVADSQDGGAEPNG